MISVAQQNYLSGLFSDADLASDLVELRTSLIFKIPNGSRNLRASVVSSGRVSRLVQFATSHRLASEPSILDLNTHGDRAFVEVSLGGFALVRSTGPSEKYSFHLADESRVYADKKGIHAGHYVVFRLVRPGVHEIKDLLSGATCHVEVTYPRGLGTAPRKVEAAVVELKANGFFSSSEVTVLPIQPLSVKVNKLARLTTRLVGVTNRVKDDLFTHPTP